MDLLIKRMDEFQALSSDINYREHDHELDDMNDRIKELEYNSELVSVRLKHVEDSEDHELEHVLDNLKTEVTEKLSKLDDKFHNMHKELHEIHHQVDKDIRKSITNLE